jgi:putative DNA primase/helicase
MREDFWEFEPTHKLVVFGNDRPRIKNIGQAIERRLRLVPFGVSFIGREDKELSRTLMAELSGVLRWLVEGCLAWQASGIPETKAVSDATSAYLRDEDTLGQFVHSECVLAPDAKVTRKEIRDRYVTWSEARDERPVSAKTLAEKLRRSGVIERRVRTEMGPRDGWVGLRLATDDEKTRQNEPCRDVVTSSDPFPVQQVQTLSRVAIGESLTTVTTPLQTDALPTFSDYLDGEGIEVAK